MSSPFPGMNPYLEHPEIWSGIHLLLIAALAESLTPQLRPKYFVSVEVRMYQTRGEESLLVGIPDVSIHPSVRATHDDITNTAVATPSVQPISVTVPMPETIRQGYLEIREVKTKEVVTAVEVLSPVNKRSGKERDTYLDKRNSILGSVTHFVEIDLLRKWEPMPLLSQDIKTDYRILISRSDRRPRADLYAFNLPDRIPSFNLPLRAEDEEPIVDLQDLLDSIYERAGYDMKLDYAGDIVPPLAPSDRAWVEEILSEQGIL